MALIVIMGKLVMASKIDPETKEMIASVSKFFNVIERAKTCTTMFTGENSYPTLLEQMTSQLKGLWKATEAALNNLADWFAELVTRLGACSSGSGASFFNEIEVIFCS